MAIESRTSKSIINAKVSLSFYFINLILQFFSRKVFIDYLGAEVLGLNTTVQNLLGFLNLAELGISSAISFSLYKPLFEGSKNEINEIVSLQGWLYRRIAVIISIAACVLMLFFPKIFEKAQVPMWYTYASFVVLLFSALLGYVFNYKQIVLTADQKEYKVTLSIQGFRVIKVGLQILAVIYLSNGYLCWILLEFIMAIITTIVINATCHKEYPWLNPQPKLGNQLRFKYSQIITKTKQIFFHKIGGFVFSQSSSIILYAFANLTLVAIYGNYMLIIFGLQTLIGAVFNSVNASIGNLVAENNQKHILNIFNELFTLRFYIITVVSFCCYYLVTPFIILWVGKDFLLDETALFLIVIVFFIDMIRTIVDSFNNAYGLFHDVWATITESCINIGCSIWLGSMWGLHGIIAGRLVSLILIIFLWKPYLLCHWGLKCSVLFYWKLYMKCFLGGLVSVILCKLLLLCIPINPSYGYVPFITYAFVVFFLISIILLATLYIFNRDGIKASVCRLLSIVNTLNNKY